MIQKYEINREFYGPNIAAKLVTKRTKRNTSLCFSHTQLRWLRFIVSWFSLPVSTQHRYYEFCIYFTSGKNVQNYHLL